MRTASTPTKACPTRSRFPNMSLRRSCRSRPSPPTLFGIPPTLLISVRTSGLIFLFSPTEVLSAAKLTILICATRRTRRTATLLTLTESAQGCTGRYKWRASFSLRQHLYFTSRLQRFSQHPAESTQETLWGRCGQTVQSSLSLFCQNTRLHQDFSANSPDEHIFDAQTGNLAEVRLSSLALVLNYNTSASSFRDPS